MSQFSRLFYGLTGDVFGHAIGYIIGDGIVKQGDLLGYQRDIFAQLSKLKFVDIGVIKSDLPLLGQVKTGE